MQQDPSLKVCTDEETGQTIISGMGELHLDIIVDRMRREFSVEANIGKPQVAYRERITKVCEIEGKIVNAEVPLSEMFGYATDLRSATQGRATFAMEFSQYSEAPSNVAQEIISRHR